jgi:adenylosuccinate lyase
VSGQTYPRKVDYASSTLAGIATSSSKFAHDLRLLQHLKEVEEPFEDEQIGSSAMPYKRNPMRAERICALARHVIALAQDPAFTAATQWLERTLDDSANRALAIPDAYLARTRCLLLVHNVPAAWCVNPRDPPASRRGAAVHGDGDDPDARRPRGGDRQDLHERIRRHSLAAASAMKEGAPVDLLERIAATRPSASRERDRHAARPARASWAALRSRSPRSSNDVTPVLKTGETRTRAGAALHV